MTRSYITESSSLQNPESGSNFWKRCCHVSKLDGFSLVAFGGFIFSLLVTFILGIQLNAGILQVIPAGSVSSDDKICSEAGAQMIKNGGNSIDAVITSLLCLSVTQPQLVGPGGGGMIMIYDHKKNETKIFDFMMEYLSENSAVGIPGFLKGLKKVQKSYGFLAWNSLFEPAINLAKNGFNVSDQLKKAVDEVFSRKSDSFSLSSRFVKEFSPNGIRIAKGVLLTRPKYAEFLLDVSQINDIEEMNAMNYSVEILEGLQDLNDSISVQDFHNYNVVERHPLRKLVQNVSIATAGPPFGGFQVLAGLQLTKELGISVQTHPSELYRGFTRVLRVVSSNADFFNRTSLMSTINASQLPYWSSPHQSHSATQVSVVDTFDVFAAAVASLGDSFGSGMMTSHGIVLNGVRDLGFWSSGGFDGRRLVPFAPLVAAEPGSICGQRVLLSSGSWSDILQTLTHMIFRNLELIPALLEPRISLSGNSREILINDFDPNIHRLPTSVRQSLKTLNFTLSGQYHPSGVNGVSKTKDSLVQFSDPRSGGKAISVRDNIDEL